MRMRMRRGSRALPGVRRVAQQGGEGRPPSRERESLPKEQGCQGVSGILGVSTYKYRNRCSRNRDRFSTAEEEAVRPWCVLSVSVG